MNAFFDLEIGVVSSPQLFVPPNSKIQMNVDVMRRHFAVCIDAMSYLLIKEVLDFLASFNFQNKPIG